MKTTIDELLTKNSNLLAAVLVLIQSAKDNHDSKALYKWDLLRQKKYPNEN